MRVKVHPVVPMLVLAGVALAIWATPSLADLPVLLLAGANLALPIAFGVSKAIVGGLRPVATTALIFTFSWLGVAPIIQLDLGRAAWGDTTALADTSRVTTALLIHLVAVVALLVGISMGSRSDSAGLRLVAPAAPVRGAVLLGFIVVHLLVAVPSALSVFGLGTYFTSRNERRELLERAGFSVTEVGGAQFALATALPVALSIAITLLALLRIQARWSGLGGVRGLDLAAFVIGLASIVVFCNPLSQTRFISAAAFGSLALMLLRPRRPRAGALFALAALAATLLAYPAANAFRGDTASGDVTRTTFTSNDFDGFQQILNTVTYTEQVGHSFGQHILAALAYPVPRSIWPGKADPASLEIAQYAGYRFTNLSLPIDAELYKEFWWFGPMIGMALLGYAIGRVDAAWLHAPTTRLAALAPLAAMSMLGVIRGPLGAAAPIWMTALLLLWFGLRPSEPRSGENGRRVLPRTGRAAGRADHRLVAARRLE